MMVRTPEEIKEQVIELGRLLCRVGYPLDRVRFYVTYEEAVDFYNSSLERSTLSGDDGPYWPRGPLMCMGMKFTTQRNFGKE